MLCMNSVDCKADVLWRGLVVCPLILLSLYPKLTNCVDIQKRRYDEGIKKHEHKTQQIEGYPLTYLGEHVLVTLANTPYNVLPSQWHPLKQKAANNRHLFEEAKGERAEVQQLNLLAYRIEPYIDDNPQFITWHLIYWWQNDEVQYITLLINFSNRA
jgi:hypothetical protein